MTAKFALKTTLGAALMAACAFSAPAAAEMSKQEVEQIVRDYLIANPEILMEMSGALQRREAELQVQTDKMMLTAQAKALTQGGDPEVGNPKGSLTIVEFFDYNCGYCKRTHPLIEQLLSEDKDIRYIHKHFPILSESSELASRAALAAQLLEPSKYSAFHDKLYRQPGSLTAATIEQLAKASGLDWAKLNAKMNDSTVDQLISTNRGLAGSLSISGTPAFVIGDQILRGAPANLTYLKTYIKRVRDGKPLQ
ncbi:MAG: DsbA family protein [Aeromonas sp.]